MRRRTFLASAIPVSLAGVLLAKEGKPDRLSGTVKLVDKDKKELHMAPRNTPNGQREILWDDNTKWTLEGDADTQAAQRTRCERRCLARSHGLRISLGNAHYARSYQLHRAIARG